jgi:hypothetical protein
MEKLAPPDAIRLRRVGKGPLTDCWMAESGTNSPRVGQAYPAVS